MTKIVLILNRGFSTSPSAMTAIKHVTVIGGGIMGSGIAQVTTYFSFNLSYRSVERNLTYVNLHTIHFHFHKPLFNSS